MSSEDSSNFGPGRSSVYQDKNGEGVRQQEATWPERYFTAFAARSHQPQGSAASVPALPVRPAKAYCGVRVMSSKDME
jgi:hypothetical protein